MLSVQNDIVVVMESIKNLMYGLQLDFLITRYLKRIKHIFKHKIFQVLSVSLEKQVHRGASLL